MAVRRADDRQYLLASNLSASGAAVSIPGGEYMFMVDGVPAGATVSLQFRMPNLTWVDVQVFTGAKLTFTTLPGNQTGIDLPAGDVRMASTGGTPTGLYAYLVGLG